MVEHRETTKIFHLMCHQMLFWCGIRCKTFLDNYGCGCAWAVPDFPPAIPGPEVAAPISWAPGILRSFCREETKKTSVPIKFLILRGYTGRRVKQVQCGKLMRSNVEAVHILAILRGFLRLLAIATRKPCLCYKLQ